jgi:tartrate-resistant acid phosphatase type 5
MLRKSRRLLWPAAGLAGIALLALGANCRLDHRQPLPADRPSPGSSVDYRGAPRVAAPCVTDASSDAAAPVRPTPAAADRLATHFAVMGDYGDIHGGVAGVATLIKSWRPDFIITTGDNNYPVGAAETIDANIGQFFHEFIHPYLGTYGCGATSNRFFPSLGNHDWYTGAARPYLDYFQLPGNERYYEVVKGDVHLFAIDSDIAYEPDGATPTSIQGAWLRTRLAASTARWQVVYMHHPPYSSAMHGSSAHMQWPYKEWGADVVFAGHDHSYERIQVDGVLYIVIGLGGRTRYAFNSPVTGSQFRFSEGFGAVLVDADPDRMRIRFFTTDGALRDRVVLGAEE